MTVTATSSMARSIASAIALVSRSTVFQDRVGAADETEALDHIYAYGLEFPDVENLTPYRPCAVIDVSETFKWNPIAQGCTHIRLDVAGQVIVIIEDNADLVWLNSDSTDDYNDSFLDFCNFAGGVMDDMSGLLNNATFDTFGFDTITMLSPPTRSESGTRTPTNDFWFAVFAFERQGIR